MTLIDDLARSSSPHACIWPGNARGFEDVEGRMLERKGYNVLDSVEEVALRDADVAREPFCDDDSNAAK